MEHAYNDHIGTKEYDHFAIVTAPTVFQQDRGKKGWKWPKPWESPALFGLLLWKAELKLTADDKHSFNVWMNNDQLGLTPLFGHSRISQRVIKPTVNEPLEQGNQCPLHLRRLSYTFGSTPLISVSIRHCSVQKCWLELGPDFLTSVSLWSLYPRVIVNVFHSALHRESDESHAFFW